MSDPRPLLSDHSSRARRYLALVQDPRGYPAPGGPLPPKPPEGPEQPMLFHVVKAEAYDELRELLVEAHGALFGDGGYTNEQGELAQRIADTLGLGKEQV